MSLPSVELDAGLSASAGAAAELQAALTGAAIHDASYRGCLRATGDDALDLLNRLSTNKVDRLPPGHWAPTTLTTDRGRIVDVLRALHTAEAGTLLLTSPGRQPAVMEWLDKYTIMEDLEVQDVSGETAQLLFTGPAAAAVLGLPPDAPGLADGCKPTPPGVPQPLYAGEALGRPALLLPHPVGDLPGWLLLCCVEEAADFRRAALARGAALLGDAAWEALRVRQGLPAFGSELGEPFNPLETGLMGAIDFTKGCYIGQEVIARLDSYHKVQRYLARLRLAPGAEAVPGAALLAEGAPAGQITSVAPRLEETPEAERYGLGFVRTAWATPGAALTIAPPHHGEAVIESLPQLFGPGQDFS